MLSYDTDFFSGVLALGMMSGLGRKPSEDNKVIVLWAKSFIQSEVFVRVSNDPAAFGAKSLYPLPQHEGTCPHLWPGR